jgi:hypothetical protein
VKLFDNPIIRMLAVVVAIAVSTRLVFELLVPISLYLIAGLVGFVLCRVMSWYRGRS